MYDRLIEPMAVGVLLFHAYWFLVLGQVLYDEPMGNMKITNITATITTNG